MEGGRAMRPRLRQDRWYTLAELATVLEEKHAKLVGMSRPSRRKHVWRLVRMLERRDGERYSKRVGRALYVSRRLLESLLPLDERVVTAIENSVAEVAQNQRAMRRQLNAHGARISNLEKRQKLADHYLNGIATLDRDATGT